MKIIIETNGRGDDTRIFVNEEELVNCTFFEFNVNTERSNKATVYMMKFIDNKLVPMKFHGEDLRKFDEAKTVNDMEAVNVIGKSRKK